MSFTLPTKSKRRSPKKQLPVVDTSHVYVMRFSSGKCLVLDEYYDSLDEKVYLRIDPLYADHSDAGAFFRAIADRINRRENAHVRQWLCGKQNPNPPLCATSVIESHYATVCLTTKDEYTTIIGHEAVFRYRLNFHHVNGEYSRWHEIVRPLRFFGTVVSIDISSREDFVSP